MGPWQCSSTHLNLDIRQRCVVTLDPGKEPLIPINWGAGWFSNQDLHALRREKYPTPTRS